jgi:hypothetical protein
MPATGQSVHNKYNSDFGNFKFILTVQPAYSTFVFIPKH